LEIRLNIAHVALLVRDYDDAIAYFVHQLGFVLVEDEPRSPTKRWVLVAPPGEGQTALLLARAANDEQQAMIGRQGGGRVFLFMHTDNFDRDHAAFLERGVKFIEKPRIETYGKVAVFEDLYGNKWDLIEKS
jgi:catechol 2,3-dioxygenase-like lactoylglutathione lyase family enzyme